MLLRCITCSQPYEESDTEPYLCPPCLTERKAVAAQLDKKNSLRPKRPVKSDLQIYDESQKVHGFLRVRL